MNEKVKEVLETIFAIMCGVLIGIACLSIVAILARMAIMLWSATLCLK